MLNVREQSHTHCSKGISPNMLSQAGAITSIFVSRWETPWWGIINGMESDGVVSVPRISCSTLGGRFNSDFQFLQPRNRDGFLLTRQQSRIWQIVGYSLMKSTYIKTWSMSLNMHVPSRRGDRCWPPSMLDVVIASAEPLHPSAITCSVCRVGGP